MEEKKAVAITEIGEICTLMNVWRKMAQVKCAKTTTKKGSRREWRVETETVNVETKSNLAKLAVALSASHSPKTLADEYRIEGHHYGNGNWNGGK